MRNEKLSHILNREVLEEELQNTIPLKFISKYKYPLTYLLAEEGMKTIKAGDILFGLAALEKTTNDSTFIADAIDYSIILQENKHAYFIPEISQDLMSPFLLQMEEEDSLDSLMKELKEVLVDYVDETFIKALDKAVNKSFSRLLKEQITILGEREETDGFIEEMTKEELISYGMFFDTNITVEKKSDSLDLVALKELVLTLKGKEISETSIGIGFFGKILPELKNEGFDSIIFKIQGNLIKEIKTVERYQKDKRDFEFGPVAASCYLVQAYGGEVKSEEVTQEFYKEGIKTYTNKYFETNDNFFKDGDTYFVLTEGAVATAESPKENQFRYEGEGKVADNGAICKAAEIFAFRKEGKDKYCQTRLYFVPYKPSMLHLIHQDGEIVFGNNDMSLNSCSTRPNEISFLQRDKFIERDSKKQSDYNDKIDPEIHWSYSPAMLVAQMRTKGKIDFTNIKFKMDQSEELRRVLFSVYNENSYTRFIELDNLAIQRSMYYGQMRPLLDQLTSNSTNITKRLYLPFYLEFGRLSFVKQIGYLDAMGVDYYMNNFKKMLETTEKIQKIKEGK